MKNMEKAGALRYLMVIPLLFLVASFAAEWSNCKHARMEMKADLDEAIAVLAMADNDQIARQDTIRRLEEINFAMAQPLFYSADQTVPGTLFGLSIMSTMSIMIYRRGRNEVPKSPLHDVKFTPMQRQLVDMLANAPNNCVAKRDICTALWGNKDNAEESLYTLIRRTKQTLAAANAEIICNRGESYELRLKA